MNEQETNAVEEEEAQDSKATPAKKTTRAKLKPASDTVDIDEMVAKSKERYLTLKKANRNAETQLATTRKDNAAKEVRLKKVIDGMVLAQDLNTSNTSNITRNGLIQDLGVTLQKIFDIEANDSQEE